MVVSVKTIFEGTQDEVVAKVLAWADLMDLWEAIEDLCDPLDILDAEGSDYIVEDLESEIPGQCDRIMTFIVSDEDQAKKALRSNIIAVLDPPRQNRPSLHLVKG